jgi:hypothetical protein
LVCAGFISLLAVAVSRITASKGWKIPKTRLGMERNPRVALCVRNFEPDFL